ncbi:MAG: DUF1934 domain-containing protein [Lachnospiraceae bacterium]|nr:DUF1934 domain-containing protein [Lachnospiraceae bacterium]
MLASIEIVSTQSGPDGETGTIIRKAEGDFCLSSSDEFLLSYDEDLGETDPDGPEGQETVRVHTDAVINRHMWRVIRSGALESDMMFVPGRSCDCEYRTPYGCITLTIDDVHITMLEQKTDSRHIYVFEAAYRLQKEQYCIMKYRVEPAAEEDL